MAQHLLSNRKYAGHILILGSEKFYEQTKQAIELLQRKDPASYQYVNEHLAVIATFTHSGTNSFLGRGIFLAGEPSVTGSLIWYAGVLVHEATHVYLYRARKTWQEKLPPYRCFTGAWRGDLSGESGARLAQIGSGCIDLEMGARLKTRALLGCSFIRKGLVNSEQEQYWFSVVEVREYP